MNEHAVIATKKRSVGYQGSGSAKKDPFMGDNNRRRERPITYVLDNLIREVMAIDQDWFNTSSQ